jgi:hypothetical protein
LDKGLPSLPTKISGIPPPLAGVPIFGYLGDGLGEGLGDFGDGLGDTNVE